MNILRSKSRSRHFGPLKYHNLESFVCSETTRWCFHLDGCSTSAVMERVDWRGSHRVWGLALDLINM